jgi:hypothetical protein
MHFESGLRLRALPFFAPAVASAVGYSNEMPPIIFYNITKLDVGQ